jgi:hypothetical protein
MKYFKKHIVKYWKYYIKCYQLIAFNNCFFFIKVWFKLNNSANKVYAIMDNQVQFHD